MFIENIEIENWKCWRYKVSFNFKQHELIKWKNGTGKSSLMEAINYAIWGKYPIGFNANSVRNKDDKPCNIIITFSTKNELFIIKRSFGNVRNYDNICELYINDKLICESNRTIEDYMNKIINSKISTQLWTNNLVTSDILKDKFFQNNIIDDIIEDPRNLIGIYDSTIRRNNKKINSFNEEILDINEIEKSIEIYKEKLKNVSKDSSNNKELLSANKAKEAFEDLEKLKKNDFYSKISEITDEIVNKYNNLERKFKSIDLINSKIEEEEKKTSNRYSLFNKRILEYMLDYNKKNRICYLCGSNITDECNKSIEDQINSCGRSDELIKELKDAKEFLSKYDKNILTVYIKNKDLNQIISKCPNFEEIIKKNNTENEKLWKEFDNLNNLLGKAKIQQEKIKEIKELEKQNIQYKDYILVLKDYIRKATNYFTYRITNKASMSLLSMNNRYKKILLTEDGFKVAVLNENTGALEALSVHRLSSGEKTICALSLLLAVHDILVPELPLIFDETFAALDSDNLNQVKKFLNRQKETQIFIITHDQTWEEF